MSKEEQQNSVSFTKESFKAFQRLYAATVEAKQDTFMFEGNEFFTGYAKYMIEFLKGKFK